MGRDERIQEECGREWEEIGLHGKVRITLNIWVRDNGLDEMEWDTMIQDETGQNEAQIQQDDTTQH